MRTEPPKPKYERVYEKHQAEHTLNTHAIRWEPSRPATVSGAAAAYTDVAIKMF